MDAFFVSSTNSGLVAFFDAPSFDLTDSSAAEAVVLVFATSGTVTPKTRAVTLVDAIFFDALPDGSSADTVSAKAVLSTSPTILAVIDTSSADTIVSEAAFFIPLDEVAFVLVSATLAAFVASVCGSAVNTIADEPEAGLPFLATIFGGTNSDMPVCTTSISIDSTFSTVAGADEIAGAVEVFDAVVDETVMSPDVLPRNATLAVSAVP